MTTTTETVSIRNLNKDSLVVIDIETTLAKSMSAQMRDIMIAQALLRNTILFLKKIGIENPGEAADLLHSVTIDIWDEVDHADNH